MLSAAMLGPGVDSPLLLRIAAAQHSVDRTQTAVEACRRSAMLDPLSAAPLYAMGYYMERGGWPADLAENLLRQALDFEPDCDRYRVGLVAFLHRRERFGDAYEVAFAMSPEQLAALTCACCLVRLFDVFERSEDAARAEVCRARLAVLFGRAS